MITTWVVVTYEDSGGHEIEWRAELTDKSIEYLWSDFSSNAENGTVETFIDGESADSGDDENE